MAENDDVEQPSDDGLSCPEVGSWAEEKHRLVSLYAKLFSSGMKDKWNRRIYVDLYAGAGYNRVRGTSKIILGSPIRALTLEHPFDKYVFCEQDAENLEALKVRLNARWVPQPLPSFPATVTNGLPTFWRRLQEGRATIRFFHFALQTPST